MLYCKLDNPKWIEGDFSDTTKITGTIYTDRLQTTAKDLTGYTLTLRIFPEWRNADYFNKTASIVVAANGTWSYALIENDLPREGQYMLKIELEKSGERLSTYPISFEVIGAPFD